MCVEIEHKFLVSREVPFAEARQVIHISQGYLSHGEGITVRVRKSDDRGFLTIKGASTPDGLSRPEFEYEIPSRDADALLALCHSHIIKKRHLIEYQGYTWEVDIFEGDNAGLILAEIELSQVDELPPLPSWMGQEVTGDPRYYNAFLVDHPYHEFSNI